MYRISPRDYAFPSKAQYNPVYVRVAFVAEEYLRGRYSRFVYFKHRWRRIEIVEQDGTFYKVTFSGLKERRFCYGASCWIHSDRSDIINDINSGEYWFQMCSKQHYPDQSYSSRNRSKYHPNYKWFKKSLDI